jgi:hypothetical protein
MLVLMKPFVSGIVAALGGGGGGGGGGLAIPFPYGVGEWAQPDIWIIVDVVGPTGWLYQAVIDMGPSVAVNGEPAWFGQDATHTWTASLSWNSGSWIVVFSDNPNAYNIGFTANVGVPNYLPFNVFIYQNDSAGGIYGGSTMILSDYK